MSSETFRHHNSLEQIETAAADRSHCQRQQALLNVLTRIRESLPLDTILRSTATEIRQWLNVDRVAVFRFRPDSERHQGEFIVEAALPEFGSVLTKAQGAEPGERYAVHYQEATVQAISTIDNAGLSDTHLHILKHFQIQASLTVPLMHAKQLWGLLCVQQCSHSRPWTDEEVQFAQHVALPLEVAIQQAEILSQTRLQTQRMLKRYAEQATDLYNNAPCGYHSLDEDGILTQINDTELNWLGCGREKIVGRAKFADLLTPESRELFERDFPEFKQRGWVQDLDLELLRADGSIMSVSLSATAVKDADGHYLMSRSTVYDMTNRKQAEAEIRRQQWLLRAILDNIPHRVWFKDENGIYVAINQSHSLAIGLTPEQLIGKTEFEIWSPEEAEAFRTEDVQVMDSGKTISFEEQVTLPDGAESWFATIKTPVFDRMGLVRGVTGISMDITDRKRVEQQLQASQILLDAVINGTSDPIFVKDEHHRWVQFNHAFCEFLGVDREEILNKSDYDLFPEAQADKFWQRDKQIFATGIEDVSEEVVTNAEGQLRYISTKKTYFEDVAGKKFLVGTIRDITNRKQAEEKIQQQKALLQRSKADLELRVEERTAELQQSVAQLQQEITDRRQAEQALNKEREFLNALLNHLEDGIVACDENGNLTLFNRKTQEFHGLPHASLPPDQWAEHFDLFCGDGQTRMQVDDIPLFRAFRGEIVKNAEMVIAPKQGKTRSLLASGQAFFDDQGEKLGAVAVMHDITEQQAALRERNIAEAALRQSEIQLREKAEREQLLSHLTSQICSSLDLNHILGTAVRAIRDLLEIDRCSFLWYRLDQEEPCWEVVQDDRIPTLPDTTGVRVIAASVPILTVTCLQQALIRIDNVQTSADPVVKEYFASSGHTAILALSIHTQSGEIGVVHCSHFAGPRPWDEDEIDLLQAVAANLAIAIDQAELYKQSRLAAEMAQRQAQQVEQTLDELRRTQAQMIQSEKMSSLGQLVAGVAHEINNPVNFIYGNLSHANDYTQDLLKLLKLYQQHYPCPDGEILQEADAIDLDFLIEDLPKLLLSMKVGADRIQRIVASLRNFSRMDEAEFKAVNIHEGIDSTLMILQNRLKAKPDRPTIEIIKEYSELPLVECYAGQLNQVFMNILSNSIDALEESFESSNLTSDLNNNSLTLETPHEPNLNRPTDHPLIIQIRTGMISTDRIVIHIADNGPGMPELVRNRIFDPFFTTKPIGKGTGMGMSISYQIVTEKHGGSFKCLSKPGQGAEFVIEIPIQQ